jgi:hypothetical protein
MKILEVDKEVFSNIYPDMSDISSRLDRKGNGNLIDTMNWKDFNYKPEVRFNIGYSDKEILLKFYVKEEYFKAEKTLPNQAVYEDSCVEFFISPENDGIYYNFEFNGIGTCLLGSGAVRENRKMGSPEIIAKIRRLTSLGNEPVKEKKGELKWTITLAIPFDVFFLHKIKSLKGKTLNANFYKCGDKLTIPHYLTWNPVGTTNPDYHQSGYFGQLKFI